MSHDCPRCGRACRSWKQLSSHLDRDHPSDPSSITEAFLASAARRDLQEANAAIRQAAQRRAIRRAAAEPIAPTRPPLPAPYFGDIDIERSFENGRTLRWYAREELKGTSAADAPEAIATEQSDTLGAAESLHMDPRRGFRPQRAILAGITEKLGLKFHTRVISVPVGPNGDTCDIDMHYRKLEDASRFFYRFLTPGHCRPRVLIDPITGGQVYSDPYTAGELHKQYRELHMRDPTALILALKLYWDETNLTKNGERVACPVSVSNLALDIDDLRKRTPNASLLLSYLTKIPERVMAELNRSQKTPLRKVLHRAQMRALFDGVLDSSMVALLGCRMVGAHGREENVYPSVLGLSLDYPKIAEVTQTLQNETCWVCYARKGFGFWSHTEYDLRTNASQRLLIGRAWAQHPDSAAARCEQLRPVGLHPNPNPCFNIIGLDTFQGHYHPTSIRHNHSPHSLAVLTCLCIGRYPATDHAPHVSRCFPQADRVLLCCDSSTSVTSAIRWLGAPD